MGRVQDKVAIVTGSAEGIGEATAYLLAKEGAKVIVTDINDEGGQETVEQITSAGGEAVFQHQDVALEEGWASVLEMVESNFGALHILVNNAGYGDFQDFETEANVEQWRRLIGVNLESVMFSTRLAIPLMRKSGGGSIVNICSGAGMVGMPRLATYSAAKGGIRAFSKTMAVECGVKGDNIRVNTIYPGMIHTTAVGRETANMLPGMSPLEAMEHITQGIPARRMGTPEEIAQGVLFLASDEASYVTGAELAIDGGYTAQ